MLPSDFREKLLTAVIVVGAATLVAGAIFAYERYYRGPDESFFVGTWRGHADYIGETRIGYRFKPDHTYEAEYEADGKWQAGGDFLYLRQRFDGPGVSVPYSVLQVWHIDSMTQTELRMHEVDWRLHAVLNRVE